MRPWLTPRCVLLMALLLGAPTVTLGHLLTAWLPATLAAARLQRQVTVDAGGLESTWEEYRGVQRKIADLRTAAAEQRERTTPPYLPERRSHAVFEKLGQALGNARISVRQLRLGEPYLYAVVPPRDLLACEDITIECDGDYAALTESLERMLGMDVPVRCKHVVWTRAAQALRLSAQVEVPFAADGALRQELIGDIALEEFDES